MEPRLRRSLLFMPGSNARALEKAKGLAADVLIFDLEDGVSPSAKAEARSNVLAAVNDGDYGMREKVVRVNTLSTQWGKDDLLALAQSSADGIMLPKVESAADIEHVINYLNVHRGKSFPIWCNIETPKGILAANAIAGAHRQAVTALVAGTNDFCFELKIERPKDRTPLHAALSMLVLAARAHHMQVFDGTFVDLKDQQGFEKECEEGKRFGFDGKTLIHPDQIAAANRVFSPSAHELAEAQNTIAAFEAAEKAGHEVTTAGGKMIERLHYERANQLIYISNIIAQKS